MSDFVSPTTKQVQVNCTTRSYGTCNNFTVDFQTRDLDKVVGVTLIEAKLARMFTNIQSWNNTLNVYHPAGIPNLYTIPVGQYNIIELTAALNAATAATLVSWTYDAGTRRLTATQVTFPCDVDAGPLSTIAPYIGLTSTVSLGSPTALASPPQLNGPDLVYIKSNLVAASSTVVAGTTAMKSIVGMIDYTQIPFGFSGSFMANSLTVRRMSFPGQVCMRKMDIQIVDEFDHPMNIPENCFLNMTLQFTSMM